MVIKAWHVTAPSSFEDLRTSHERDRRKHCSRCGRQGSRPAVIRVMLNELVAGKRQESVSSRSVTLCEACGVETYKALVDTLLRESKR